MEIKVNDYVRDHINGIGKIIKCYDNELEIVFKKARVKTSVSSYFEFELNKSSPNIIDLIEVGDYVNGQLVTYVGSDSIEVFWYKDEKQWLDKEDIKSILTKEMFEQMEYKIN